MRKIDSLFVGHIGVSSIQKVAENSFFSNVNLSYAMFTSIDSSRDLINLSSVQSILKEPTECHVLGSALVIYTSEIQRLSLKYRLLNGFDEVWLFLQQPTERIPSNVWITAPLNIENRIPPNLIIWLKRSGCILGLGDGIGLNYISRDPAIAEMLESWSCDKGWSPR